MLYNKCYLLRLNCLKGVISKEKMKLPETIFLVNYEPDSMRIFTAIASIPFRI